MMQETKEIQQLFIIKKKKILVLLFDQYQHINMRTEFLNAWVVSFVNDYLNLALISSTKYNTKQKL
jgi:hypothetical protein